MSLAGNGAGGDVPEGEGLYSKVQCIMGIWALLAPVGRMTDRRDWKHYLPATSLSGGEKRVWRLFFLSESSNWVKFKKTGSNSSKQVRIQGTFTIDDEEALSNSIDVTTHVSILLRSLRFRNTNTLALFNMSLLWFTQGSVKITVNLIWTCALKCYDKYAETICTI